MEFVIIVNFLKNTCFSSENIAIIISYTQDKTFFVENGQRNLCLGQGERQGTFPKIFGRSPVTYHLMKCAQCKYFREIWNHFLTEIQPLDLHLKINLCCQYRHRFMILISKKKWYEICDDFISVIFFYTICRLYIRIMTPQCSYRKNTVLNTCPCPWFQQ
jgi:hypothetical protein